MNSRRKPGVAAMAAAVLAVIAAAWGSAAYGQGSEGTSNRPPGLRAKGAEVTRLEIAQGAEIGDLAIRNQTGRVKSSWYFKDPDGDNLTFTAEKSESPGFEWLEVESVKGGTLFELSGVPGADAVGAYAVAFTITASDDQAERKVEIQIQVTGLNDPPEELSPPGDKAFEVGGTKAFDYAFVASDYARDANGDALSLRFRGTLPRWLSATPARSAAASVTLAGDPEPQDVGRHSLTMRITDGRGGRLDIPVTVTVHANRPPALKFNLEAELKTLRIGERAQFSFARADGNVHNELDGSWYFEDPDGDDMTLTLTSRVDWLQVGGDLGGGRFQVTGTVPADVSGNIGPTLTLTASDGQDSTSYWVSVEIIPRNDPPRETDPPGTKAFTKLGAGNFSRTFRVADYATDPDGDALEMSFSGLPGWLAATPATASATVTLTGNPGSADDGSRDLTMRISDGNGGSLDIGITLAVHANIAPALLHPPSGPTRLETREDTDLTATVIDGSHYFEDPDGDSLTYTLSSSAGWVDVEELGGGRFEVTGMPLPDSSENAELTLTADDGELRANHAIAVVVTPVNDGPQEVNPPGPKAFEKGGVGDFSQEFRVADYAFDPEGDPLTMTFVGLPAWLEPDTAAAAATVTLTGSPGSADVGSRDLTMRVSDGNGGSLDIDITLAVHANRRPEAKNPPAGPTTLAIEEDTELTATAIDGSHYFEDPDGDSLTYTLSSSADWVAVEELGGGRFQVSGMPMLDFTGSATLTLTADDSELDNGRPIVVQVTPVNDPPRETSPPGTKAYSQTGSGDFRRTFRVVDYAQDIDGDTLTISFPEAPVPGQPKQKQKEQLGLLEQVDELERPAWPDWLTASPAPGGAAVTLEGDPDVGDAAVTPPLTLTMEVSDGNGGLLDIDITLTVHANRRPETITPPAGATTPTTAEDTELTATVDGSHYFEDPDDDSLTYTLSPSADWVEVEELGGGQFQVTGTPPPDSSENAELTLIADDGELRANHAIAVVVTPVNDDPRETKPPRPKAFAKRGAGNFSQTFRVADYAEDVEGDPLVMTFSQLPGWLKATPKIASATVTLAGNPKDGDAAVNPPVSFFMQVSDGNGGSLPIRFMLAVHRNNAPALRQQPLGPIRLEARKNRELVATVIDGSHYFEDPDDDSLTYTLSSSADWVEVEGLGGSRFQVSGTAPSDFSGSAALVLVATDGDATSSPFNLPVEVPPGNRNPTETNPPGTKAFAKTGAGSSSWVFRVADYAEDPDGDPLVMTFTGLPDWLKATPKTASATVTLAGNPTDGDAAVTPPVSFLMQVSDGNGGSLGIDIDLAVHANRRPVRRVPPLTSATLTTRENIALGDGTAIDGSDYFEDPDGDSLTYTLSSNVSWVTVTGRGGGRFEVSGMPPKGYSGTLISALTLIADDSELSASRPISVEVADNNPPVGNETRCRQAQPQPYVILTKEVAEQDGLMLTVNFEGCFGDVDVGDSLQYRMEVEGAVFHLVPPSSGIRSRTAVTEAASFQAKLRLTTRRYYKPEGEQFGEFPVKVSARDASGEVSAEPVVAFSLVFLPDLNPVVTRKRGYKYEAGVPERNEPRDANADPTLYRWAIDVEYVDYAEETLLRQARFTPDEITASGECRGGVLTSRAQSSIDIEAASWGGEAGTSSTNTQCMSDELVNGDSSRVSGLLPSVLVRPENEQDSLEVILNERYFLEITFPSVKYKGLCHEVEFRKGPPLDTVYYRLHSTKPRECLSFQSD